MDIQSKRKLKEVIRGLIGDGFQGTQTKLASGLQKRGFHVTQSTISRILNQMGVIKEIVDGKQIYKLGSETKHSYRGTLSDLVINMSHNESIIVIKTKPGSAMFVAGFIDFECKNFILGTVAGDDTIFVAPIKSSTMKMNIEKLSNILQSKN